MSGTGQWKPHGIRTGQPALRNPTEEQIASWHARLFRTALRMTGSADDAADLTQQAFAKAWARRDQFNGRAMPTTWLHRILVNCVADWHRRRAGVPPTVTDPFVVQALPGGTDSADQVAGAEQLGRLHQAVQDLPDGLRAAFVTTVIDGHSYRQAAELLSVPLGTVASRVHEARKKLQRAVGDRFAEDAK